MSISSRLTAMYCVASISGDISISIGVEHTPGSVSPSWFSAVLALTMALSILVSSSYSKVTRL